jgi:hypothetical protein
MELWEKMQAATRDAFMGSSPAAKAAAENDAKTQNDVKTQTDSKTQNNSKKGS